MPNDNIILEFPASNIEIDLGETITFDQISGFLPIERITGDIPTSRLTGTIPMENITGNLAVDRLAGIDGVMTENEAHAIWNNT